jgi:hypothetical protein
MGMIATVLNKYINKDYVVVFMNDILIYFNSVQDNKISVSIVMNPLRKHNF